LQTRYFRDFEQVVKETLDFIDFYHKNGINGRNMWYLHTMVLKMHLR